MRISPFTTYAKPTTARPKPVMSQPLFGSTSSSVLPKLDGLDLGKAFKSILSEGDIAPLISSMKEESTETLLMLFNLGANALNSSVSPQSLLITLGVLAQRRDIKNYVEYYSFQTPENENARITQRFFKVPNSKYHHFLLEENDLPSKNRLGFSQPVKKFILKGYDKNTNTYRVIADEALNLVSKNKKLAHQLSMLFASSDERFSPKHADLIVSPHPPNRLLKEYLLNLLQDPSLTPVVSYLDTLTRRGAIEWQRDHFPESQLKPTQSQAQVIGTELPDGSIVKLATYLEEKPEDGTLERTRELFIAPPNTRQSIQKLDTVWRVPTEEPPLIRYTPMPKESHSSIQGDAIEDLSELSNTAFYLSLSKAQVAYLFPANKLNLLDKGIKTKSVLPDDLKNYFEVEFDELKQADIQDVLNPKKHLPQHARPVALFDFHKGNGDMRDGASKLPENQVLVVGSPLDLSVRVAEYATPVILYRPELISDNIPEGTVLIRQNEAQILDTHHPEPLHQLETLLEHSELPEHKALANVPLSAQHVNNEESKVVLGLLERDLEPVPTSTVTELIRDVAQADAIATNAFQVDAEETPAQEKTPVESDSSHRFLRLEDVLPDDVLTADDVKALLRPVIKTSKEEFTTSAKLEEHYSTVLEAFSSLLECSAITPESGSGLHWVAKKSNANPDAPAMYFLKLPQRVGEPDIYAHIIKQSKLNEYLLSFTHSDRATHPFASVFISNQTDATNFDMTDVKLALKRKGGQLVDAVDIQSHSETDTLTRYLLDQLNQLALH